MKKMWKKVLIGVMTAVLCLTTVGVTDVQAASTNKVLAVDYSFKNLTFEKDPYKCRTNIYTINLQGTSQKTAIKNLKFGGTAYIPKAALKKKGASVEVAMSISLIKSNGSLYGDLPVRYAANLVNESGKVKLYVVDQQTGKNVKTSSYATMKNGTGTYKNYYVVTLKNIPLEDKVWVDTGTQMVQKKITSKTKYAFEMAMTITGQGSKNSGTFYVDNVTAKDGSKTVVKYNFSKNLNGVEVRKGGTAISSKKFSIKKI